MSARARRHPRAARWLTTAAAMALSTYALDAFATATGAALAASGLLADLEQELLVVLLAATYALWGAGLGVNLGANWALLEATGTSTNLVSKAAFDLACRLTPSVGARRAASAAGYIGVELVKEVPYYLAAAGAVLLSDGVSAADALVFLAGTNVGAAVYECALGWSTRAALNARARRAGGDSSAQPGVATGAHAEPSSRVASEHRGRG